MNLLPNGKILAWGKTDAADTMGMPRLWDPATGSPEGLPMIAVDTMLFCAGHVLLPDGRLMVAGGHLQDDRGIATTYLFDQNGSPQRVADMAHGRWYPTLTVLPNGEVLSMAGRNEAGTVIRIPEIWEGNQWNELPGASGGLNDEIPYYPRNFVDPKNGLVFYAGERVSSRWFDVDGTGAGGQRGRWIDGPDHVWPFNRDYGTAVMYEPGKILFAGGGGHTGWPTRDPKDNQPTATAEIIDLNDASPQWRNTDPMSVPRRHLNSTILPDGQVLVTGGTRGAGFVNIDEGLATRAAEVWNPATGAWTTLASNQVMRIYHSVSLLMPDGRVLHGASGDAMAIQPGGAIVPVPPERSHEMFSPPYLFKGARPTISSAPATVGYGEVFSIATPNIGQITEVRWIRLGAVTHAFDMSQRANTLEFTPTDTGVDVTAPANGNLAPPGHYLLFIHNRNGVPSEGEIVQVQ
jgi:galactose oxidase